MNYAAAFDYFQRKSGLTQSIEENKETLRLKYAEAKAMGERANRSREAIGYLKSSIEALRREK